MVNKENHRTILESIYAEALERTSNKGYPLCNPISKERWVSING